MRVVYLVNQKFKDTNLIDVWPYFDQTISTHFGTVSPLSMNNNMYIS